MPILAVFVLAFAVAGWSHPCDDECGGAEAQRQEALHEAALRFDGWSEAELLAHAAASESARHIDIEGLERERFAIAERLVDLGTEAAQPLLESYTDQTPRITAMEVIHRHPVEVPVYPFDRVAELALHRIAVRGEAALFAERLSRGDWNAFRTALSDKDGAHPALEGALIAVRQGPRTERRALLAALRESDSEGGALEFLRSELLLLGESPPERAEFLRMEHGPALHLVLGAREWPEDVRGALLSLARERKDLRSVAILLDRAEPGLTLRERLGEGGASAALAVSRDTPAAELGALAGDESAGTETRRLALVGLMLQRTEDAKGAVRELLGQESLPEELAREARGWLGE